MVVLWNYVRGKYMIRVINYIGSIMVILDNEFMVFY